MSDERRQDDREARAAKSSQSVDRDAREQRGRDEQADPGLGLRPLVPPRVDEDERDRVTVDGPRGPEVGP